MDKQQERATPRERQAAMPGVPRPTARARPSCPPEAFTQLSDASHEPDRTGTIKGGAPARALAEDGTR